MEPEIYQLIDVYGNHIPTASTLNINRDLNMEFDEVDYDVEMNQVIGKGYCFG